MTPETWAIQPHMQDAYADLCLAPKALPLARQLAGEVLSLPMMPHLALEAAWCARAHIA